MYVRMYTCCRVKCLLKVSVSGSVLVCLVFRCVCTLLCLIQPACLLPLVTRPLLFSCPPDRQYARAPPQSFIGSYCHLTQIQYASIDCVEMQSGSPQQRSKQSKFNKTPPPAFSPGPDSTSQRGTNVFMCVERNRGSSTRSQLLLDALFKEPVRPHKQNMQEVTSALTSLPAKRAFTACCQNKTCQISEVSQQTNS